MVAYSSGNGFVSNPRDDILLHEKLIFGIRQTLALTDTKTRDLTTYRTLDLRKK